ncbi:transposase [Xanthovirga aplysinae]|uniref:transposase n=1 Tax=Xanthovirga aplysinae TaxID=2529853 RepID=UPI0012BC5877|nr:transposase [Xanthovirga aplysinae]MTI29523.1 hypothetical protein [Xanthovirga aplysinae]
MFITTPFILSQQILPTLIEQFATFGHQFDQLPDSVTAYADYGIEENYEYLQTEVIEPYVKYPHFHKEQKIKGKLELSDPSTLHYDKENDRLYCPASQPMDRIGSRKRKTSTGFEQYNTLYQARNCERCPLKAGCHKQKVNRIVALNSKLNHYKQKALGKFIK